MSFEINKPSYNQSDKIQYHVTHQVEPIVDDGKGNYNISPIGFPVRDVSASLPNTNPTLIQPKFDVGHNAFAFNAVYTAYTNISTIGLQTISSDIKTLTQSAGTATVVMFDSHGYTNGQHITISGSVIPEYNGVKTINYVDQKTFSFSITSGTSSPSYGNLSASITLTDGMIVELLGQDDYANNGYYKVRNGVWQTLLLASQVVIKSKGAITDNIDFTYGWPYPPYIEIHSLSIATNPTPVAGDYIATFTTAHEHGFSTGQIISISSASIGGYDQYNIAIEVITPTSFSYVVGSALAPDNSGTPIAYYSSVDSDIILVNAQTNDAENGYYVVYSYPIAWIKLCERYRYNGTENDNKIGDYGKLSDNDGNALDHYRKGYSLAETAEFMRSNMEMPLQFAQFKGSSHKIEDQGAFIQWMMSGRKLNIGGGKGNNRVVVDGLGLVDSINPRIQGEIDLTDDVAILDKQTKIKQESKLAVWGLTSHHSRSLEGFDNKSPYVKDYPFIYNSEYDATEIEPLFSGGHKDPIVDVEHTRISVHGTTSTSNGNIRPICMDTLWYHRDNAYHNNITLDMSNPSVYGRHTMSIVHNLDTQDMVILMSQDFTPANVNVLANTITVEDGTEWKAGDYARFVISDGTALPSGLNTDTTYMIADGYPSANTLIFTTLTGSVIDILTVGAGNKFTVQRLAYPIYNNSEVVLALDDLSSVTLSNSQKLMLKVINGDVTKYYYRPRKKQSVTLNNGSSWSELNLTYATGLHYVRVFITSALTDYVEVYDVNKTSSDILTDLQGNTDLIPLPFDSNTDVKYLMELFCDNSNIDSTLLVNKRAKIRAKKTFIHLPTPIDMEDGTTIKLDVSLPVVPDTNSFGYNTVGSLSGYANYVTQPRAYVLGGYQKILCTDISIASIENTNGDAIITLASNHMLDTLVFTPSKVNTTLDTIQLTTDTVNYSLGSLVTFYTDGTLPISSPQIIAGDAYLISSIIDDKIKLKTVGNVDINFTSTGTGTSYLIIRNKVKINIIECSASDYNKEFIATILNKNSFKLITPSTYTASVSNSGIVSQIVVVSGSEGIEGLTERNNSAIFGAMPEVEYGSGNHIYHQTFTSSNLTGINTITGSDKRVVLATVYPTSTSTFQWRMDNDPQLKLLQWSMLNVNAGGGDTGNKYPTGSFANVAYAHNLDIIRTFSDVFTTGDTVNFTVYDNPLTYTTEISPDFTQQQINALVRVRFPETLETELLDSDKNTVASFNYQARTAYLDLIHDFITSRVMVNDNKDFTDSTVIPFNEYSVQLPENHNYSMFVPTAFYDTWLYRDFLKFDAVLDVDSNATSDAIVPWTTKGIYTPSIIYDAYGDTNFPAWNPYGSGASTSTLPNHLKNEYQKTDEFSNNASSRYTHGSLESMQDPSFAFGYGSKNKFISYAQSRDYAYVDDLKRRLWIDTYVIPDARFRQLENMFNLTSTGSKEEDIVKFYGSNWIPFAKIFSTDNISPANGNIVDVVDYGIITGNSTYINALNTFKTAINSNPIATRFIKHGYVDSFVSVNTRETTSDQMAMFLRNYLVGYSNNMPIDFYNGFKVAVYGNQSMASYVTDTYNTVVNTESDAERIYRYSLDNYCYEYLVYDQYTSSNDVTAYINDNFLLKKAQPSELTGSLGTETLYDMITNDTFNFSGGVTKFTENWDTNTANDLLHKIDDYSAYSSAWVQQSTNTENWGTIFGYGRGYIDNHKLRQTSAGQNSLIKKKDPIVGNFIAECFIHATDDQSLYFISNNTDGSRVGFYNAIAVSYFQVIFDTSGSWWGGTRKVLFAVRKPDQPIDFTYHNVSIPFDPYGDGLYHKDDFDVFPICDYTEGHTYRVVFARTDTTTCMVKIYDDSVTTGVYTNLIGDMSSYVKIPNFIHGSGTTDEFALMLGIGDLTGYYTNVSTVSNMTKTDVTTVFGTSNKMLVRDINASWMTFENGNPSHDAPNSTIKHAITVSGMNYIAERDFYMNKMKYNYTRVHMSFVFSKSAGRWIPLDYKQIPTSYLTPTFGSVALKQMERSIKIPKTNDFVPIYDENGNNTLENATYPIVNGNIVRDFLWKNPMCGNDNPYKVLSNFGYWEMEPMQLNENCYPFLGNMLPYDTDGNLLPVMDHNMDYKSKEGKNSDDYRFSRLLQPNVGINFIVPNNVHGGAIDPNTALFLYQPHMWSVYWNMRTAVSAMDGCDIPSPTDRTGGVMADPVLNSMFQYPNARNPQFYIPWHEDMSTEWLNSGWLVIDARIRDQVNNQFRYKYFEFHGET